MGWWNVHVCSPDRHLLPHMLNKAHIWTWNRSGRPPLHFGCSMWWCIVLDYSTKASTDPAESQFIIGCSWCLWPQSLRLSYISQHQPALCRDRYSLSSSLLMAFMAIILLPILIIIDIHRRRTDIKRLILKILSNWRSSLGVVLLLRPSHLTWGSRPISQLRPRT